MAKLNDGILGGFKGKVGNIVGYTYKGQNVIRKYQPLVTNPNTTQQVATRGRFKTLSQLWSGTYKYLQMYNYGTKYTAVYQRVLQQFMNSAIGKSINAKTMSEQRGSNEAIFAFINKAPKDYYNTIAGCYGEKELNVFSPEYMRIGVKGTHVINNLYKSSVTWGKQNLYFGTDVLIPTAISVISIDANSGGIYLTSTPIALRQQSTVALADGLKNRGFFETAIECGSGWKYIYQCGENVDIPILFADCSFTNTSGVRNIWQIACASMVFIKDISAGTNIEGIDLLANISKNVIDGAFPS